MVCALLASGLDRSVRVGHADGVSDAQREVAESKAVSVLLDVLAAGESPERVLKAVEPWFERPARGRPRVLLEVAADAFVAAHTSRSDPLELAGLAYGLLPERRASGNTWQQKRRYALTAAVLIAGGAEPEDNGWWRDDDLWVHAVDAVIVMVRAAAKRRQVSVADICAELRSAR